MGTDNDILWLKSSRLEIGIYKPLTKYKWSRFDWTGFIGEVILDGEHRFCVTHSDANGEVMLGRGLCNEFGMHASIVRNPELKGDGSRKIPKIGVGLLPDNVNEREQEVPLEEVIQFPKTYTQKDSSITFVTEPVDYEGYAVRLEKTISVDGNQLTIDYTLENTGSKVIDTEEYCHNFVRINDHKIGPEYQLETGLQMPEDMKAYKLSSAMVKTNKGLTWSETPEEVYFFRIEQDATVPSYEWQLIHEPTGVGMKESGDFTPYLFAIWGLQGVVSPEVFVKIDLTPGESMTWQRRYEFFA